MFGTLDQFNRKPLPFAHNADKELWMDPHVAAQRLAKRLELARSPEASQYLERASTWLLEGFTPAEGRSVCVLGCGHGRYARALAERGARVTGVDLSAPALAYARAEASEVSIDYVEADYLDLELGARFNLIMLPNRAASGLDTESLERLGRVVRRHLAPGGTFLLDCASTAYLETRKPMRRYAHAPEGGFWSPEPHYVFRTSFTYPDEGLVLDRWSVVERGRTREHFKWTRCFHYARLFELLFQAGLIGRTTYSGFAGRAWQDGALEFASSFYYG